jgi:flagellin-like protein
MKKRKLEISSYPNRHNHLNKKGISPVIATVLLIAMVVVIALIVFVWFRGMVGESVTKFGKNIKLVCDDVSFDASYSGGELQLFNTGQVPIFKMNMKRSEAGGYSTEEIEIDSGGSGLTTGGTFSGIVNVGNSEKITLIPILVGTSASGKKTYICEGRYGKEIIL